MARRAKRDGNSLTLGKNAVLCMVTCVMFRDQSVTRAQVSPGREMGVGEQQEWEAQGHRSQRLYCGTRP